METPISQPPTEGAAEDPERLAYSIHEAAGLLGVDYFSIYRLIQRGKLRACRAAFFFMYFPFLLFFV